MSKKIVLILQGGGALGAFQCGAWRALAPFIRENNHQLAAVAGVSIGAINAAMIARHYLESDNGCDALEDFWRHKLAYAPVPFFPFPGNYWDAWNGLLSSALLGNRAIFSPAYQHWNAVGEMNRFQMPIYDTHNAVRTLTERFGKYRGTAPLLAIGATDVQTGKAVLFDSLTRSITPQVVAAAIGIPLLFTPAEVDGRYYWDAEVRSNTLLPEVFDLLRRTQRHADRPENYLAIVVDLFNQRADNIPSSGMQSQYRIMNIVLGGKLKYDAPAFDAANAYLEAMERLHAMADPDTELGAAVEKEYRKALDLCRARIELLHVSRQPLEFEHISRDFNYSPRYIEELIQQGFDNTRQALRAWQDRA